VVPKLFEEGFFVAELALEHMLLFSLMFSVYFILLARITHLPDILVVTSELHLWFP
jgi:hypothetical protein